MKWFLLIPLNLLANILAAFLSPLWCLFADDKGTFPRWLQWAATPDYNADGDPPFKEHHAPYKGEQTGFKRYLNRIVWMFRNPAYGFDFLISFKPDPDTKVVVSPRSTREVGGDVNIKGWYFARATNSKGQKAWQLYITHHWNETHGTKLNFGWKLWSVPGNCQYVFSPTGFWKARK